jgi:hypothetical protein
MKNSLIIALGLLLSFCKSTGLKPNDKLTDTLKNIIINKMDTMTYSEKLVKTKSLYPFKRWRDSYNEGLVQYTEENCNKVKIVFDELIDTLIKIGENASKKERVDLFKNAILALNKLNDKIPALIETGEREDLCELIDQITIACSLDPKEFGDGAGIADEWRDW